MSCVRCVPFSPPPQQRLLLLDSWRRSGLPAGDFASLVGISKHTLYKWNEQFKERGPEGLMDQPRGARSGGRLPELTKRTIVMLKESHPEWGCERISDMLLRGPALAASPSSVARVLHEAGYQMVVEPTRAHPDKVRRFERAKPNQRWEASQRDQVHISKQTAKSTRDEEPDNQRPAKIWEGLGRLAGFNRTSHSASRY